MNAAGVVTILLPLLLGGGILRALGLRFRDDRTGWLGRAWVVGALATGLVMFALLWTESALRSWRLVLLGYLALSGAVWFLRSPRMELVETPRAPRWERVLFGAALALALVATLLRVLEGDLVPVYQGDEANFWALKAKVIDHAGGFNAAFGEAMSNPRFVHHKDYPLLNPLLQVWAFGNAGALTDVAHRVPMQAFAVAFVLVLASALRRAARPAVAAAILLCVVALPETGYQTRTAHADLMVALGALTAFDAWLRRREGVAWWRLMAVALAFMLWSKHEGLIYAVAILGACAVEVIARGRKTVEHPPPVQARLWMLLPAAIVVLTWSFDAHYGFQNDILIGDTRDVAFPELLRTQAATRIGPILSFFGREVLLDARHSSFLTLAFVVLLVLLGGAALRRSELRAPAIAILLAFAGYVVVFAGTPHDLDWHLGTAAARVSWQAVPAVALWVALAYRRVASDS